MSYRPHNLRFGNKLTTYDIGVEKQKLNQILDFLLEGLVMVQMSRKSGLVNSVL